MEFFVPSLKLTTKAPEDRPKLPKGKESSSNHPFSGAFAVSFREGNPSKPGWIEPAKLDHFPHASLPPPLYGKPASSRIIWHNSPCFFLGLSRPRNSKNYSKLVGG